MQVAPPSFTSQIRVVRGRNEAHRLRGTSEHVADRVRQPLEIVRRKIVLVVDDVIMRGPSRTLKSSMRYDEQYVKGWQRN